MLREVVQEMEHLLHFKPFLREVVQSLDHLPHLAAVPVQAKKVLYQLYRRAVMWTQG